MKTRWMLAALAWGVVCVPSARAAEPAMARGSATITEMNYFVNFNTSAYSLTIGTMEVRAEKKGPPCEGFADGQTAEARYDAKTLVLERDKKSCKLTIRRMEFTEPPSSAPPATR